MGPRRKATPCGLLCAGTWCSTPRRHSFMSIEAFSDREQGNAVEPAHFLSFWLHATGNLSSTPLNRCLVFSSWCRSTQWAWGLPSGSRACCCQPGRRASATCCHTPQVLTGPPCPHAGSATTCIHMKVYYLYENAHTGGVLRFERQRACAPVFKV